MMKKLLATTLLLIVLSSAATAQVLEDYPKYEVRAVWLTTLKNLDWPKHTVNSPSDIERQKQELRDILTQLQRANVNTVLLQTRVRASTIYPSDIEPWDQCLTGRFDKAPGYDPLQFAIDECHVRGMEIHAWLCTLPVGQWNSPACKQLRKHYPKMIIKVADDGFMNPERDETGRYLARISREIVSRYDVDGIHLDYIRYPEQMKLRITRDRARSYITKVVRDIHDAVKAVKPYVKMSCSPIGKHADLARYSSHGWNAREKVCQDAQEWLRLGLMDQLYPMLYFKGNNFYPFAADWQENSYGRTIAAGLGIYFLDPREGNWKLVEIDRQMNVSRQLGLGHAYFRSKFLTDNTQGIYRLVATKNDAFPSLVPPMTWETSRQPAAPTDFFQTIGVKNIVIEWRGSSPLYNIYASTADGPVDTDDAANIIATRVSSRHLSIPISNYSQRLNFAVTAVDRFGNESVPLQSCPTSNQRHGIDPTSPTRVIPNDGKTLEFTTQGTSIKDHFTVEDLQGRNIRTYNRYEVKQLRNGKAIVNISNFPDGVYQLRSVNAKNVKHRMGFFIIKR